MNRLFKRLTPFLIAIAVGLLVHAAVQQLRLRNAKPVSATVGLSTPLSVQSIPDLDFPDAVKRSNVSGTVRLEALFDVDGKVKNIRPYPMVPFGVPESAAGHWEYAGYTSARTSDGFVKELPFGLTQLAIEQVGKINFVPKHFDGQPQTEVAYVLVSFGYHESRFSTGCNEIEITVMNSEGTVWHGDIWTHRNRGCIMI